MTKTITVIDPTAPGPAAIGGLAPRPADPSGRVVGFRQKWHRFDTFNDRLEELLRQRYAIAGAERVDGTIGLRKGPQVAAWQAFQEKVDWAVVGLGG